MTARRALTVAGIAAVMTAGMSLPAAASPPQPTPEIELHVVDQTIHMRNDGQFRLVVELRGGDDAQRDLAAASASITTHERLVAPEQVAGAVNGQLPAPLDTIDIAPEQLTDVELTGDAVTASLALAAGTVDFGAAGVHPVMVTLSVGPIEASAVTFVAVVPADDPRPPLAVAILAGVADPGPWPAAEDVAELEDAISTLLDLGSAVDGPLSMLLPAGALVALATPHADGGDGSTAPATTTATVPDDSVVPAGVERFDIDRISNAFRTDEIIATPAFALDPSAVVDIDESDLFTRALRRGEDIVAAASPGAAVSRSVWVTDVALSARGATLLRNLGVRLIIFTDEVAEGLGVDPAEDRFSVRLGAAGALSAMTVSPLGVHLQPVPSTASANERAARMVAELLLLRERETHAVLLATPQLGIPDPATTARFAAAVNEVPGLTLVPLSRLPGLDGPTVSGSATAFDLPDVAGADLTSRRSRIDAVRGEVTHAVSMLADPTAGAAWNDDLDRLLSSRVADDEAERRLAAIAAEVDAVIRAIGPPEPFTFTMTGTSSTLRLRVENVAAQPLRVRVVPRSPKLAFPEEPPIVEVAAEGAQVVEIPVRARSNGTFTIEVDVLTPDGYRIADPVILKARVSRITGLSQVMSAGAALVLASWWFSHLRHNRRRATATATGGGAALPAEMPTVSPDAAEAQAGEHGSTSAPGAGH